MIKKFDQYLKQQQNLGFIYCGIMSHPIDEEGFVARCIKTGIVVEKENITPEIFPILVEGLNNEFPNKKIKLYQLYTKKTVENTMDNIVIYLYTRLGFEEGFNDIINEINQEE